jgi:hypothetical protein
MSAKPVSPEDGQPAQAPQPEDSPTADSPAGEFPAGNPQVEANETHSPENAEDSERVEDAGSANNVKDRFQAALELKKQKAQERGGANGGYGAKGTAHAHGAIDQKRTFRRKSG